MVDYVLINTTEVDDDNLGSVGEVNPYAYSEMCPYTCCMVPPPVWRNCRCSIHRNDRDSRKYKYKYNFTEDLHSHTYKHNIKRSNSMEILQIEPPINERDLKTAYKKMALKTHPDKCGSNEQFIKVNEAYNELLMLC